MSLLHVTTPKAAWPVPKGLKAEARQTLLYKPIVSDAVLQTQKDDSSTEG